MSSSGEGGKPAQLGLVDMGDIRFYDDPAYYPPSFNTSDLASYTGSFSEMVLNVAWQQLQPTQGGALDTAVIDSAIAAVTACNAQHGTNLGIKLRVWGGFRRRSGPRTSMGRRITITGKATDDPYIYPTPGRSAGLDRPTTSMPGAGAEPARQPLRQQSPDPRHFPDGRTPRPPTNPSCR